MNINSSKSNRTESFAHYREIRHLIQRDHNLIHRSQIAILSFDHLCDALPIE